MRDHGVEVRIAEPQVVHHLTPRGRQRPVGALAATAVATLAGVPHQSRIGDAHGADRLPELPHREEGRIADRPRIDLARVAHPPARPEMFDIPVHGAQRRLVPEVQMPEEQVVGLGVAIELEQHPVRVDQITEVLAVGPALWRCPRQRIELGDRQQPVAIRRQPRVRHSVRVVRPGMDREEAETFAAGIERRQAFVERQPVGAGTGRPERALRRCVVAGRVERSRRRFVDPIVEMMDAVGRERRESGHLRDLAGRPDDLPPIERRVRIDRVDVQVMECRFRQRRRTVAIRLRLARRRRAAGRTPGDDDQGQHPLAYPRAAQRLARRGPGPTAHHDPSRSGPKNARRSSTSNSGCSMAAKCPPRGISVQWVMLYDASAHFRGEMKSS